MAFRLEFATEAERDFGLIFDHLQRSYLDFGESPESTFAHAESRTAEIRAAAERILTAPHRGAAGTQEPALTPVRPSILLQSARQREPDACAGRAA